MRLRSEEVRALQAEEAAGRVGGTSVVTDAQGYALYFSKRLIPHLPKNALDDRMSPVRLHVGVYAYRSEALERYAATPVSELEMLEGLEQLRFLVARVPMAVVDTSLKRLFTARMQLGMFDPAGSGPYGNIPASELDSPAHRALALRAYDPKTDRWAIWWLDGRYPSGPLDPPVKGVALAAQAHQYSAGSVEMRL